MDQLSKEQEYSTIVIVGGESSLHYLLRRYAERIGCSIQVVEKTVSIESIRQFESAAVIFPSIEILDNSQALAVELTNSDIPIIVCSSVFDQSKTRDLGADYCLLHPLGFDSFSSTLKAAAILQRESRDSKEGGGELPSINPV